MTLPLSSFEFTGCTEGSHAGKDCWVVLVVRRMKQERWKALLDPHLWLQYRAIGCYNQVVDEVRYVSTIGNSLPAPPQISCHHSNTNGVLSGNTPALILRKCSANRAALELFADTIFWLPSS